MNNNNLSEKKTALEKEFESLSKQQDILQKNREQIDRQLEGIGRKIENVRGAYAFLMSLIAELEYEKTVTAVGGEVSKPEA